MANQLNNTTHQLIDSFLGDHPMAVVLLRELFDDMKKRDLHDCLREAAYLGIGVFCRYAVSKGIFDPNAILCGAAEGGHWALCELAYGCGADQWDRMLSAAALGGHRHVCELAKAWGARDWDYMLTSAAFAGHADLCRLAVKWGARDWDGLRAMVPPGDEALEKLAGELKVSSRRR